MNQAITTLNNVDALLRQNGFDPEAEMDSTLPNSNTIDLPRIRIDIRDNGSHKLYVDYGESYLDAEEREHYLQENKLEGVIIASQLIKSYWKTGDTIPVCSSIDGNIRSENPLSDSCANCSEAIIGEGLCKSKIRLLLLSKINDKITPLLLNLPPTSIKHFEAHKKRLMRSKLPLIAANTVFSLVPVKKNGYQWGEIEFSMNGIADKEMLMFAKKARDQLKKFTEHIAEKDYVEQGDKVA